MRRLNNGQKQGREQAEEGEGMMEQAKISDDARTLAMLKRIEWGSSGGYCPDCHGWEERYIDNKGPHDPDCELKATIDRLERVRG